MANHGHCGARRGDDGPAACSIPRWRPAACRPQSARFALPASGGPAQSQASSPAQSCGTLSYCRLDAVHPGRHGCRLRRGASAHGPQARPNPGTQGLEAQQSQLEGVARARRFRVIFKAALLEPLKRIAPSAAVAVAFYDNLSDRRSQDHGAIVVLPVGKEASGVTVPRARELQARGRGRERCALREPAPGRQPPPQGVPAPPARRSVRHGTTNGAMPLPLERNNKPLRTWIAVAFHCTR